MGRYLLIFFMWVGVSLAQETRVLELELLVTADPEILFNHVNPVQFILSSSYGDLIVEATGQFYQDDPELYWQTLEPVIWTLELLDNTNILDVQITARLALCNKQQGLCYFQDVRLEQNINLKQPLNKQTLHIMLDRPVY